MRSTTPNPEPRRPTRAVLLPKIFYPFRRHFTLPVRIGLPTRATQHTHIRSRAYFAWVTVCLAWAATYRAIAVALETIPPMLMAALRWIIAGTILALGLKVTGTPLPPRREWSALVVTGILLLGFGNGGVVWAELT